MVSTFFFVFVFYSFSKNGSQKDKYMKPVAIYVFSFIVFFGFVPATGIFSSNKPSY